MAKRKQPKGARSKPVELSSGDAPTAKTDEASTTERPSGAIVQSPSCQPAPTAPADPVNPDASDAPLYDLRQGLFAFCSSQAETMLAQYRNINDLLGPTRDWTAPGTLCEVLIRDAIRRILPSSYSVDKGFIFGRRRSHLGEAHSPEIDVLIHDTHQFAPVYRLEDFVIVRPCAVRGVIQVKRTLDSDKLQKAIKNIVEAKRHLGAFGATRIPNKEPGYDIFAAAIFFGDDLKLDCGGISTSYESIIRSLEGVEAIARPHFLGSLGNRFYTVPFGAKDRYEGFPSQAGAGNAALITFLAYLTQYILPRYASLTLHRPASVVSDETINLGDTAGAAANPTEEASSNSGEST